MFAPKEKTQLDREIDRLTIELRELSATDDDYATIVEHLNRLTKIRLEEKPEKVSPNTWAMIGANIVGIAMITWFERENVITSKALGFIQRAR